MDGTDSMVPIVNFDNDKSRDDSQPEDKRLFPSEVYWQSYLRRQGNARDLRLIVRYHIWNEQTALCIQEAALRSTRQSEPTRPGTSIPMHGRAVYNSQDEGLFALLGSPNGASSMRMLKDHKKEMGYRTVDRIIVQGYETEEEALNIEKRRTFFIVLTECRRAAPTIAAPVPRFFAPRKTPPSSPSIHSSSL